MRKPRFFCLIQVWLQNMTVVIQIGSLLLLLTAFQVSSAEAATRSELVERHQYVNAVVRELRRDGYEVDDVAIELDKLVMLLTSGDLELAAQRLKEVERNLALLRQTKPMLYGEKIRIEWLEVYGDIFRKFALIILAAYFLMRIRRFKDLFTHHRLEALRSQRILAVGVFSTLGILTAGFGYMRYGESDWAFLDLQLVFTTLCGLIAGIVPGIIAGSIAGIFRFIIGGGKISYFLILLTGGIIGGSLAAWRKMPVPTRKTALLSGLLVGACHGLISYFPMIRVIGFSSVSGIVLSLIALEMLSIYTFVAVGLGVLADERRKNLEKLLPEMKLKFLQAQINPHFLFNALNTIAAICSREKAEQARHLVVKLSSYFRRIVKREDDWVTIEEEMKHIDSYLEIERARYQDSLKIEKEINLGKKGLRSELPILILQPLVENAIKHGIAPKGGGGLLKIIAWENENNVEIQVIDNGVGITPEVLETLHSDNAKKPVSEGEGGTGIGLRNINERLRYQFGSEYCLQIKSQLGVGTTAHFKIPFERKEEE